MMPLYRLVALNALPANLAGFDPTAGDAVLRRRRMASVALTIRLPTTH